jgi:FtsP/CotA-like multicopper oxidase with cupredoxin domain
MMGSGSDEWTINGKRYPATDPIAVRKGELIQVRLGNMSMEAHPMHLHGQSFKVVGVNGASALPPPSSKTAWMSTRTWVSWTSSSPPTIRATGSSTATNPCRWRAA